MFSQLNWDNLFCAGGSVLGCVDIRNFPGSDVDFFIYGCNLEQANQKLDYLIKYIRENDSVPFPFTLELDKKILINFSLLRLLSILFAQKIQSLLQENGTFKSFFDYTILRQKSYSDLIWTVAQLDLMELMCGQWSDVCDL